MTAWQLGLAWLSCSPAAGGGGHPVPGPMPPSGGGRQPCIQLGFNHPRTPHIQVHGVTGITRFVTELLLL